MTGTQKVNVDRLTAYQHESLTSGKSTDLHHHDSDRKLVGYTVANLPEGSVGDRAYVTDATAPTFRTAVVGSGAVVVPVFFDGTDWVAC